jgi:hypothetical protein
MFSARYSRQPHRWVIDSGKTLSMTHRWWLVAGGWVLVLVAGGWCWWLVAGAGGWWLGAGAGGWWPVLVLVLRPGSRVTGRYASFAL